jgi:hypothetical protein
MTPNIPDSEWIVIETNEPYECTRWWVSNQQYNNLHAINGYMEFECFNPKAAQWLRDTLNTLSPSATSTQT